MRRMRRYGELRRDEMQGVSNLPQASLSHAPHAASHAEIWRMSRFLLVGITGTAIDFFLLWLLKKAGLPILLANSLSFSCGAVSNFVLNRLWTFPEARSRHWALQMMQFFAVSVVGLGINDLVVMALQAPLGSLLRHPGQGYLAAKVVATGVAVVWNYFGNRLWTFGEVGRVDAGSTEVNEHAV